MTLETVLSVFAGCLLYQIAKSIVKYYWKNRNR